MVAPVMPKLNPPTASPASPPPDQPAPPPPQPPAPPPTPHLGATPEIPSLPQMLAPYRNLLPWVGGAAVLFLFTGWSTAKLTMRTFYAKAPYIALGVIAGFAVKQWIEKGMTK